MVSVITNVATVTSATADPNGADNTATANTEVVNQSDLVVSKADSPDPVTAGTNLTYTLTLTNGGPSDAQSVALSDAIPVNTTFVSMMETSGPAFTLTTPPVGGTGTATANIATFAAGASATFTLVVKVNAAATGTISNTASVTSTTVDLNAVNDTATATTTVNTAADLVVTKSDSPDPVNAGSNITYALTLTNNGPSDAQTVSLADAVPAGTRSCFLESEDSFRAKRRRSAQLSRHSMSEGRASGSTGWHARSSSHCSRRSERTARSSGCDRLRASLEGPHATWTSFYPFCDGVSDVVDRGLRAER